MVLKFESIVNQLFNFKGEWDDWTFNVLYFLHLVQQ